MSLTVRVTCNRCGESIETSLAVQHWCRRLTAQDVEALIEKFLDDLSDRSGFALEPKVREMIHADWRAIAQQAFKDVSSPPSTPG
jgi:hypothetical protein